MVDAIFVTHLAAGAARSSARVFYFSIYQLAQNIHTKLFPYLALVAAGLRTSTET
jgi:hypothetical protein